MPAPAQKRPPKGLSRWFFVARKAVCCMQELASLICSDYQAAGKELLDLVKAGGTSAQEGVQALRVADCADPNYVANTVTVTSIREWARPTFSTACFASCHVLFTDALVGLFMCWSRLIWSAAGSSAQPSSSTQCSSSRLPQEGREAATGLTTFRRWQGCPS
jgi:hypothetical protein